MMATAGDVAGKALFKGEACRQERAADGRATALHQGLRKRQPQAPLGLFVERKAKNRRHIFRSVGLAKLRFRHRLGLAQRIVTNRPIGQQQFFDAAELTDWEAVARRQRHGVIGMKDDSRQHGFTRIRRRGAPPQNNVRAFSGGRPSTALPSLTTIGRSINTGSARIASLNSGSERLSSAKPSSP